MLTASSLPAANGPRARGPQPVLLTGCIVDASSHEPVGARITILGADGSWHFPRSTVADGSAVRYERTNWIDAEAFEKHTTLSAHPFEVELPPGRYVITVERGKEYHPEVRGIEIARRDTVLAASALAEYGEALAIYRRIAREAGDDTTLIV